MYGPIALLYIAIGVILVGVAVPLTRRKVKRNIWYGFRTPKTLSDDSVWYAANEFMGRKMVLAGVVTALAAALLDFVPGLNISGYLLCSVAVMVVALIWVIAESFRFLRGL